MKDSERTVLGYLAAFTLGLVCMGILVLVTRHGPASPPTAEAITPQVSVDEDWRTKGPADERRQTFQRMYRGASAPKPALAFNDPQAEPVQPAVGDEAIANESPAIMDVPAPGIIRRVTTISARGMTTNAGGRISGSARLLAEPPAERNLPLDPTCSLEWKRLARPLTTRHYLIGKDHGLADVLVKLRLKAREGDWVVPTEPLTIRTENCWFDPYVVGVMSGQTVIVTNADAILHNMHLISERNGEYNRAQLPKQHVSFTLRNPEESVRLKCDVHPWEFCYIDVLEHPFFAVTDRNGNFVINNVPPGKYIVEARHRKAGTLLKEITVEASRNAEVLFDFELQRAQPVPEGGRDRAANGISFRQQASR